uniref:Uncharacterized protein n=1 Tax=Glossina palpalis gambiensis TaxID=67801 RepID=A0A1B0BW82_9MUSC
MLPCCGWACKGKGEGIPLKQHHHQFLVGTQFGAGRQQHKYENHIERIDDIIRVNTCLESEQ